MNVKNLFFPIIYGTLLIAATCITFYGGFSDKLNSVTIIGWLLIIPFCVMAILYAKKTIYQGNIGGKDAAKEGLKFVILSTLILVIFQAIFFELDFKAYKINFMQTQGFELAKAQIKAGNLKLTEAQIPNLINKEIGHVTLFKECTSIVFKNLFLGIITSVITAVTLRAKLRG